MMNLSNIHTGIYKEIYYSSTSFKKVKCFQCGSNDIVMKAMMVGTNSYKCKKCGHKWHEELK